jgi:hypothetical protein
MKYTLLTVMLFALSATVFSWDDDKHDDHSKDMYCPRDVHCDNVHFPNVCQELDYLTCVEESQHTYFAALNPGIYTCPLGPVLPATIGGATGAICLLANSTAWNDFTGPALATLFQDLFTALSSIGTSCTPPTTTCYTPPIYT